MVSLLTRMLAWVRLSIFESPNHTNARSTPRGVVNKLYNAIKSSYNIMLNTHKGDSKIMNSLRDMKEQTTSHNKPRHHHFTPYI